jgi:hyperosmotically inducible protein
MKTASPHFIIAPLSALLLAASIAVTAGNTDTAADNNSHSHDHTYNDDTYNKGTYNKGTYNNGTYSEKRAAAEYWADFKQDSEQTWKDANEAFKDGWIESKLKTALILNEHLQAFNIDIQVDKDMATLEGEVYSDIERELAENIALGIEGIDQVSNRLKIVERPPKVADPITPKGRSFAQYIGDVSTTAAIKAELLTSQNIQGSAINVDTLNRMVTLSGQVRSLEEKALAQAIAAKHNGVKGVVNNLQVKS